MPYAKHEQQQLLAIARESIRHGLETGTPSPIKLDTLPASLREIRATFVTLEEGGQLRGCIGTITASLPLAEDVAQRAYAAAFGDPRFPPVQAPELGQLRISISVLTPPEPLVFGSEAELVAQIQPGVDGLIFEAGRNRGVFLPSVWEALPDRHDFLRHLKRKAGLPFGYWSGSVRVYRYRTEYFSEAA
jgi:AmmeMemoRadiSam system protein A